MPVVIALLPDPIARARLLDGVRLLQRLDRASFEVRLASDWPEVHQLTRSAAPQLVVFEPYALGQLELEACADFRRAFVGPVLVAYGAFRANSARDVALLFQTGVREIIDRDGEDRPASMRALLVRALSCGIADRVLDGLGDRLTPMLRTLLIHLLARPQQVITPRLAGRICCCHEKTLRQHLRANRFPPINRTIVWVRLMWAGHLLESSSQSVADVSTALNFPTASAFSKQFERYTGVSPGEARRAGGLSFVLEQFSAECSRVDPSPRRRAGAGALVSLS